MILRALAAVVVLILAILLATLLLFVAGHGAGGPRRGGSAGGARRIEEVEKLIKELDVKAVLAAEWDGLPELNTGVQATEAKFENSHLIPTANIAEGVDRPRDLLVRVALKNTYRSSVLEPQVLEVCARVTAIRRYAWVFVESPEGRYAIRFDKTEPVTQNNLIRGIRPLLIGEPPHKMAMATWIGFLRSVGFVVEVLPHGEEVRFTHWALSTREERDAERERLHAMTQGDFDALDWSEVDTKILPLLKEPTEYSGELQIVDGAVKVVKIRKGRSGMSSALARTAIDFHTHPYGRMLVEQPSGIDIKSSYKLSEVIAWSFVFAPEGTYIYALSNVARKISPGDLDKEIARYLERTGEHIGTLADRLRVVLAALTDLGLIVRFRPNPRWAEAGLWTVETWNKIDIAKLESSVAAIEKMKPTALFALDWRPLYSAFEGLTPQEFVPGRTDAYVSCDIDDGRIVPSSTGYTLEDDGPPYEPGPLTAIYHAFFDAFTAGDLRACARAVEARAWAWMILVTAEKRYLCRPARGVPPEAQLPEEDGTRVSAAAARAAGFEVHEAARPEIARPKLPSA